MNPLRIPALHDPEQVANTIEMLVRAGARHPALARHVQGLHPGLPLEVFNAAADIAWDRMPPWDREAWQRDVQQ